MNATSFEKIFLESLDSTVGKLFLAVFSLGLVFLLITFLPEALGLVLIGGIFFFGYEYLSKKV